jgi:hypothetical protein
MGTKSEVNGRMGLDNVAVQWPRTGRFYDPVAPAEFVDFEAMADSSPTDHIAKTGTVRATGYSELVDLLLGLGSVLYATDASAEDEDPVLDPDQCAWVAGGLERFLAGHRDHGEEVTFESVGAVMRKALEGTRLAEQQLRWLDGRLDALRDESGEPPQWSFTLTELTVLAAFYRRCADRGFAVYADF